MHRKLSPRLTGKLVTRNKLTAETKDLLIVLPFFNISIDLRTRLKNSISENFPFGKIRVIFILPIHISFFFRFNDKIFYYLRSNVANVATYYGETCQYFGDKK